MRAEDLKVVGLVEGDVQYIKPKRVREQIEMIGEKLHIWSLPKSEVERLRAEREIWRRLLNEIEEVRT